MPCPADPVPSAEHGCSSGLASPTTAQPASLDALIAALHQQTQAINRLASSNEALIRAMAEADPDEDDHDTYLDGSPRRRSTEGLG